MKTVTSASILMLMTLSTVVRAEMVPLNELRNNRVGGIVSHKETHEELYLACVEKNPEGNCIQYRFVAQLGSAVRVLGNQEVQPFELSDRKAFEKARIYSEKAVLPAMGWIGEGFENYYVYGEANIGGLDLNSLFVSPMPVLGLPGIGSVVIAGAVVYDAGRLVITLPIETLRTIFKNIRLKKLNRAFSSFFNGSRANTSETEELKAKQFVELKAELVHLSTSPASAPVAGN